MNTAFIGGGFAGRLHIDAAGKCGADPYLMITGTERSAADAAAYFAKAGASAGKFRVTSYEKESYAALSDPAVDCVHICTPPTAHAEAVRAALDAGKHVLCEKPLAMDPEEARQLAALAEEKELVCACTFNVRYHAAVQRARELVAGGTFGKVLLVHGSYLQEFHALPAAYDWRYDPVRGGDLRAVSEIGTHWFDTVQFVTGDRIGELSAVTENFWPRRTMSLPDGTEREFDVASEDAALITMRFEGGALGSVVLSEVSPGRGNYLSFEITCENGSIWWNEEENNHLHTAVKGGGIRTEVFAFGNGFSDTFEALVCEFYDAVRNGEARHKGTLPSFADGVQIVSVCDSVRRSASDGGRWLKV